ncbi:MAG TPA: helicase-related protein, partial [Blastocatellia bacterium]|nr:helicase-related protein [Blastocatellia bacterium]
MRESVQPLPIDALIPALQPSFQQHPNLVIEAAPGAGKTTRIPPALLAPAVSNGGEVWVLEPRRIAARLSARRVADEMGERLGETVGYQVRFEEISSKQTRLRFLTEGVLTRRLLSNATLQGVSVVVLDEFHERHLQTDLALSLLRHLQQTTRPDLKLVVMSATLQTEPIVQYLGDCPTLHSDGRQFEVTTDYLKQNDERPLAEQIVTALKQLIAQQLDGDVLVFLPGAAEIRRAQEACRDLAVREQLQIELLHGELSTSEQDRALRFSTKRKVILATNVAETSITIDGIVAVIDAGLARIAEHSPWSGLPTLPVRRISKASARQRAGRAGRTRPGVCLRLYTEMDFNARPEFEIPEIQRLDLAGAALELHAYGMYDLTQFHWFEPPTPQALAAAESLLQKLGAINCTGELTSLGHKMLRYPLHPRQSRLLLEAEAQGVATRGALIAVLLNERDLRARSFDNAAVKHKNVGTSDLTEREDLFRRAQQLAFEPKKLLEQGINPGTANAVERTHKQLLRQLGKPASDNAASKMGEDEKIRIAVLSGYPDRVAKRQASDNAMKNDAALILKLSNGTTAQLMAESSVRDSEFLIAVEADEQQTNRSVTTRIRTAVAIQPDWLLDLFPDAVTESNKVTW